MIRRPDGKLQVTLQPPAGLHVRPRGPGRGPLRQRQRLVRRSALAFQSPPRPTWRPRPPTAAGPNAKRPEACEQEIGSRSRWRFHPPPPLAFRLGLAAFPVRPSGSDFDLLALRTRCKQQPMGRARPCKTPARPIAAKSGNFFPLDPLDSYSVCTDGNPSSCEIELLVPPSGVSSRSVSNPEQGVEQQHVSRPSFRALGISADIGSRARAARHRHTISDPGARPPGRARRPRRAGEGADRLGQDPRLRPADRRAGRAAGDGDAVRARPRADPRARRPGGGRARARSASGRVCASRPSTAARRSRRQVEARARRAHPGRDAGPPAGSDRAPARLARPRPRRSSSTRPTGCSTWASSPRSTGSSASSRATRQTMLFSATLDGEVGELARAYTSDAVRSSRPGRPTGSRA